MNLKEREQQIVDEFQSLKDWEDRYKKIIQIGKDLKALPDEEKTEELKVKGCQSQVWIKAGLDDRNHVVYEADSDAMIVRGLVALLLRYYSGLGPDDIIAAPPSFIKELGFETNLSPSRANGLYAMVKQIKYYAMAFKVLVNQSG